MPFLKTTAPLLSLSVLATLLSGASLVSADDLKMTTIASGLDNPCGIAIQPDTGHLFVTCNKSVLRIDPKAPGKTHEEIVGFPTDVYGKGPKYNISGLGASFLDSNTLVVGGGGLPDGKEIVRFYEVGSTPGQPKKADDMKFKSGPIPPGKDSVRGEGNFYGVVPIGTTLFISCNGDDTKGWVSTIALQGGKPGKLTPTIATKVVTGVDAPTPVAKSPEGELAVGQLGEITVPHDSLYTTYDPASHKLTKKVKIGLHDITGLAFSKSGKIYALDFAWLKPEDGGLFTIKVDGDSAKSTQLQKILHPTAMAFAADGSLYITALGQPADSGSGMKGSVIKIEGLD
ncbi:hypothetical protein Pan216_49310 [Planctomycetes bacterium Pan216]|uniref:NHL repeat protein n=1 Tax=Kolteria novifilia TaxID=2527975 RepID=A0A518BAW5_9BACT|nr:hypothetical protein Pan216_49310 [Planctomycetes bacterium Pan216]